MALKDLLVHVDNDPRCQDRLEAAIGLAESHDAHLTGLFVLTPPQLPGYLRAEISDDILRHQAEVAVAAAKRAEDNFNNCVRRANVQGEWRCVEGTQVQMLSLHGRYADVVIAGQRHPSGEEGEDDPSMPDQLILASGRPVLVIPYGGQYPVIGQRVMVAWDASRLATRAISDAMPFLVGAKQVIVMAVNPKQGEEGHGEIPSADICLHLARHGVKADAQHVYADNVSVGDMLLSRAAEEGIDLMVTGAYGHARWRELVLGGVTRHMLQHMTMPVLMCH